MKEIWIDLTKPLNIIFF